MRFAGPQLLRFGVMTLAVVVCLMSRPALGEHGASLKMAVESSRSSSSAAERRLGRSGRAIATQTTASGRSDQNRSDLVAGLTWSAGAASGTGRLIWHGCAVLLDFLQPAAKALALAPVAPAGEFSRSVRQVARQLHATLRHSAHSTDAAVRTPATPPRDRPPAMVPTYRPWLDPRVGIATPERHGIVQMLDVRCDACVSSAAGAEAGETTIQSALDLQALTIIQIGGATVKLTSLQPFSLLFKKHF